MADTDMQGYVSDWEGSGYDSKEGQVNAEVIELEYIELEFAQEVQQRRFGSHDCLRARAILLFWWFYLFFAPLTYVVLGHDPPVSVTRYLNLDLVSILGTGHDPPSFKHYHPGIVPAFQTEGLGFRFKQQQQQSGVFLR